jgi:hypothetical protein
MKQTAIQELITEMEQLKETKLYTGSFKAIEDCLSLAYAKLEKEEEQIVDAITQYQIKHNKIYSEQGILNVVNNAIQYYTETFKSK